MNKAFYEALERYGFTLGFTSFVKCFYSDLPEELRIDSEYLNVHSEKQISNSEKLVNPVHSRIHWTKIESLTEDKEKLFPLQIITSSDIGYKIKQTTSTGAAFHFSKDKAVEHAVRETVERHSMVSFFYNRDEITASSFDLQEELVGKTSEIFGFLREKGYEFESFLLEFKGFKTVLLLGHNGKRMCIGSSCGRMEDALKGAFNEIIITWMFSENLSHLTPENVEEIKNLPQHYLYYNDPEKYEKLIKHLENSSSNSRESIMDKKFSENSLENLKKHGIDVFIKDLTPPSIRYRKGKVIKVIVPEFLDLVKDSSLRWEAHQKYDEQKVPEMPMPFP